MTKGKRAAPDRIIVHGTEGVGKSKFASESNAPIFIAAEDGVRHLDVASFPEPQTFDDVIQAIDQLTNSDHEFKTLVIDTADWVGHLIKDKVLKTNRWTSEDWDKFGRGFKVWGDEWRKLLTKLNTLRATKGMEIILLVHSKVANFKNPAGDDFGRYQLAIGGDEAPELLKQWADIVMFAAFEEFTTDKKAGRVKGVSTGERILRTERTAAWDAKNRHNLPPQIALDYASFDEARKKGAAAVDSGEVLAECRRLMDSLNLPADHAARGFIESNSDNPERLVMGLNKLRALAAANQ